MALALGSRRSTLGTVVSAVAAMAVAAAVAGRSCRVTEPGPEVAVRDLLQAVKTGDRDTTFELLAPATVARLEVEAKRATDLVGAAVRFSAKDLVSLASAEGAQPVDLTLVEQRDDHAVVYLSSPDGGGRIDVVRVDGRWRVELPQYGAIMPDPPTMNPAR